MQHFTQLLIFNSDPNYFNLNGIGKTDYLYGLAGDDTLRTGKGNEWLQDIERFEFLKRCQSENDAEWSALT